MTPADIERLACPSRVRSAAGNGPCAGPLNYDGPTVDGRLERGRLACSRCGTDWPVEDGLPRLYREADVRGTDRLMRVIYDGLPALHNPAVRYLLPVLQAGGSED